MKFNCIGKYVVFIQNKQQKCVSNIAQQPETQQQQQVMTSRS